MSDHSEEDYEGGDEAAGEIFAAKDRRIAELEGTIGLERIATHKLEQQLEKLHRALEDIYRMDDSHCMDDVRRAALIALGEQ